MKLWIDGHQIIAGVDQTLLDLVRELNLDSELLSHRPIAAKIAGEVFSLNYVPVRMEDIERAEMLDTLSESEEAGIYLVASRDGKQIFVTGHSEYDPESLQWEYERDKGKGLEVALPRHYYPNDDPTRKPPSVWRAHANLLFTNWLNYYVYQETPYELDPQN